MRVAVRSEVAALRGHHEHQDFNSLIIVNDRVETKVMSWHSKLTRRRMERTADIALGRSLPRRSFRRHVCTRNVAQSRRAAQTLWRRFIAH
jgi:hypothetical protein